MLACSPCKDCCRCVQAELLASSLVQIECSSGIYIYTYISVSKGSSFFFVVFWFVLGIFLVLCAWMLQKLQESQG